MLDGLVAELLIAHLHQVGQMKWHHEVERWGADNKDDIAALGLIGSNPN